MHTYTAQLGAAPEEPAVAVPPNPAEGDAVERVCEHSLGAVVNASHMACFIASGDRFTLTSTPFIVNVGLPEAPAA